MSWDEKDWAYTWITGKRCRLNLLFRDFVITDELEAESCHTIYEYNRNVDEFGIMDKQEMQKVARDYGIMIEHQYLGYQRHRFDYRDNNCILDNIDLRNPSPFRKGESLHLYQYRQMLPNGFRNLSKYWKDDLKTLETFLQKSKEQYYVDRFIGPVEKKRVEFAKNLIGHLKQDILMFCNIKDDVRKAFFTSIKGEKYRMNLLFRKSFLEDEIEHSEVEAIFYANRPYLNKNANGHLLIEEIAKMYGICIKSDYYTYDYRERCCQIENIDVNTLSPLDSINIGNFVSSLSTFEYKSSHYDTLFS